MSLSTLLEAAEFLDGDTQERAREFHPYAKTLRSTRRRKASAPNNNEKNSDEMSSEDGGKEKRRGGPGTREVHNKLEKNRRAHLKECFELLKEHIPHLEDKKTSNLTILRCSLQYIQLLKRKEKELEQDMLHLAKEKIKHQDNIGSLKKELQHLNIDFDLNNFVEVADEQDRETNSTNTASEGCSPIVSEDESVSPQKRKVPSKRLTTEGNTTGITTSAVCKTTTHTSQATATTTTATCSTKTDTNTTPQSTVKNQVAQLLQRQISQRALAQQQKQQQKQEMQKTVGQPRLPAVQPTVLTIPNPGVPQPHLTIPASSVRIPFHIQEVITKATASGMTVKVMPTPESGAALSTKPTTATTSASTTTTAPTIPVQIKTEPTLTLPVQVKVEPTLPVQVKVEPGVANTASVVKSSPGIFTLVASNPVHLASHPVTTQVSAVPTPVTVFSSTPIAAVTSQSSSNPSTPVKQVLAPGTQILTGNNLSALSQMVQQAIAQQQQQQAKASAKTSSSAQPATATQVMTAISQGATPVSNISSMTQILAPITVMTPAMVQVNPSTTQPQINNVHQPFIKTVGTIPTLIQQPFIQQTQVVGQQVVKPLIMVTMPTVVAANVSTPPASSIPSTSASNTTAQLAVSVPKSTSS